MAIVTGNCSSRINEIRKYTQTNKFSEKYLISINPNINGVDLQQSNPSHIVYYIDGIQYTDIINSSGTTTSFRFESLGYDSPDFFSSQVIKIPEKENLVNNPKIENDVFIERQEISVFNNNYKLEYIKNLSELNSFAAGSFYNIVVNT